MRSMLASILMVCSLGAQAKAQIPEAIELGGKKEMLFTEPFAVFLDANETARKTLEREMSAPCSAAWRGYQGQWAIRDGKLYLDALIANPCSKPERQLPLKAFFPGTSGPVLAEWFTGSLTVPQGKLVRYEHMGYASRYERYLVIKVERGKVVAQTEIKGEPAPDLTAPGR